MSWCHCWRNRVGELHLGAIWDDLKFVANSLDRSQSFRCGFKSHGSADKVTSILDPGKSKTAGYQAQGQDMIFVHSAPSPHSALHILANQWTETSRTLAFCLPRDFAYASYIQYDLEDNLPGNLCYISQCWGRKPFNEWIWTTSYHTLYSPYCGKIALQSLRSDRLDVSSVRRIRIQG